MKNTQYVQCLLKQETEYSTINLTSWIPQYGTNKEKVEVGKMVQLDGKDGWWEVMTCSEPKDSKYVKDHERDYKKMHTAQPLKKG